MAIGDVVTVFEGSFQGSVGVVIDETTTQVELRIEMFGRPMTITVDRAQLRPEDTSMAGIEAKVAATVRRRGFAQREMWFWEDAAQSDPVPGPAELAAGFAAAKAIIERDEAAAREVALAAVRAAFEGVDDVELPGRWLAERAPWLEWRTEAAAVTDARDAELYAGLDEAARFEEQRRVTEAAFELREQVEAWQRRGALDSPLVPEPRNAAMERELEQDPRDDAFLVYADWLQANGNPRGELIALDVGGRVDQAEALRERLLPQLLGPLAGFADRIAPRWRCGYIETLHIATTRDDEDNGVDIGKLLSIALALPSSRFIRELTIGCPSVHEEVMLSPLLHAGGPRPTLRKLAYETDLEEEMLSWTSAGEVALHELYPNLEELEVHAGRYSLTAPEYPKLRRLILRTCSIDPATIQAIVAAEWPALEELELWFGSHSYGIELAAADLAALLATPFPRLRSLSLSNGEDTDALCAAIVESPLLPQLAELAITKSTLTDEGAGRLIAAAGRLKHLESLDIDDNYVSEVAVAAVKRALPQTCSTEQREADEYEGKLHYYAAVGE
jgi:uncharacterized protein (TIGR02996 family)